MSAKSKQLAAKGLALKGFQIKGEGQNARFKLDLKNWREFCLAADPKTKPHVAQKRQPAKPGQMIHSECREHGCCRAREEEASNLVSIDAQRNTSNDDHEGDKIAAIGTVVCDGGETDGRQASGTNDEIPSSLNPGLTSAAVGRALDKNKEGSCQTKIPNYKMNSKTNSTKTTTKTKTDAVPIAERDRTKNATKTVQASTMRTTTNSVISNNSASQAENLQREEETTVGRQGDRLDKISSQHQPVHPEKWPLTLTAMTQRFLCVDEEFLERLLSAVQIKAPDIEDSELAIAISSATKKTQQSEALWLKTVPAWIQNVRRLKAQQTAEQVNLAARWAQT
jgi:hypothetical protein